MKNKNFQYLGACFINYQNLPARKKNKPDKLSQFPDVVFQGKGVKTT